MVIIAVLKQQKQWRPKTLNHICIECCSCVIHDSPCLSPIIPSSCMWWTLLLATSLILCWLLIPMLFAVPPPSRTCLYVLYCWCYVHFYVGACGKGITASVGAFDSLGVLLCFFVFLVEQCSRQSYVQAPSVHYGSTCPRQHKENGWVSVLTLAHPAHLQASASWSITTGLGGP